MTAVARPYVAGATQTNFVIEFGNIIEVEGVVTSFEFKTQTNLLNYIDFYSFKNY